MTDIIDSVIKDSVDKLNKVRHNSRVYSRPDAHGQVAPIAVGTNCLLWTGVAFVTIIGFNILRPRVSPGLALDRLRAQLGCAE